MTPKQAFYFQRKNAERRGIGFCFMFDEWVAWWESNLGPNWFNKRGVFSGQYVMARKGDEGPYSLGNVVLMLATENLTDAALNDKIAFGERHYKAKLDSDAVAEIFLDTMRTVEQLSALYGVSVGAIIDIRARRTWKRATKNLTRNSLRGRNQWQ